MVDLLGMFRRRAAKRGPQGFARPRADITALGDTIGDMLTSPVRDAPPMARDAPEPCNWKRRRAEEPPAAEKPRAARQTRAKTNGARRGAPTGDPRRLSGCA